MNAKKVKCGICGKFQTIDEIRLCSAEAHAPKEEVVTKVQKASQPARTEVHTFSTREERDAWIAENPGARVLSTNVRRSSVWSEELGKNVSVVTETFKAGISR